MLPPLPNPSLNFGAFLEKYWQTLGDTNQAEFAERIGHGAPQVSKVCTGKARASDQFLHAAARACEYPEYALELLKFQRAVATTSLAALVVDYRKVVLEHPGLPNSVRIPLTEDLNTIVYAWIGYASAKQQQYDRLWGEALTEVHTARSALDRTHHRLSAYLYDTEGALQLHQGALPAVETAHQHALEHLQAAHEPALAAINALHRGDLQREYGDWPGARALYIQARAYYTHQHDQTQTTRCNRKLAILDLYAGNWQPALRLLTQCVAEFRALGNDYELAKTNYTYAWANNAGGKFQEAQRAHREGREIAERWKNKSGKRDDFLYLLGTSHVAGDERTAGNTERAERLFTEAEVLARQLKDQRSISWNCQGRARTRFYEARRRNAAKEAAERARLLELAQEDFACALASLQPDLHRYRYAMTLVHYADFQIWKQEWEQAEENLIRALGITQELASHYYEAMALVSLCRIYRHRREFEAIDTARRRIEELHTAFTYHHHMGALRMIEAGACLDQQLLPAASRYIARAFEHALAFNETFVNELLREFVSLMEAVASGKAVGKAAIDECHAILRAHSEYTPKTLQRWEALIKKMELKVKLR